MIRSRAGFTLIELLVVLLIISVVFVAMPIAYDRVKPGLEIRSDAREIARIMRETRGRAIRDNEEATVLIDLNERFSIAASVKALSFWLRHATFLLHVVLHWPMLPHGALASLRGWRVTTS